MRQRDACSTLERAIGKLNVVETAAFGYASNGGNPAELSWVLREIIADLERLVERIGDRTFEE